MTNFHTLEVHIGFGAGNVVGSWHIIPIPIELLGTGTQCNLTGFQSSNTFVVAYLRKVNDTTVAFGLQSTSTNWTQAKLVKIVGVRT